MTGSHTSGSASVTRDRADARRSRHLPLAPGPLWGSPGSAQRRLTACATPYGNFVNRDEIKRPVYFVLFVLDSFCRTRVERCTWPLARKSSNSVSGVCGPDSGARGPRRHGPTRAEARGSCLLGRSCEDSGSLAPRREQECLGSGVDGLAAQNVLEGHKSRHSSL